MCTCVLDAQDLEEQVLWRLARYQDYLNGTLVPYFDTGMDTVEDVACRLARLAIKLARRIPLGAQAYVAIETAEVLRRHGLKGVYGLLLRKEFLAAADLLCSVLGINKQNWPLSVHELSAAIFYALAQHRAMRGLRPEGEELIHSLRRNRGGGGDGGDVTLPLLPVEEGRFVSSSSLHDVRDKHTSNDVHLNNDDDIGEVGDAIVWEGEFSDKVF